MTATALKRAACLGIAAAALALPGTALAETAEETGAARYLDEALIAGAAFGVLLLLDTLLWRLITKGR